MLPPLPRCSRWAYSSLKLAPSISAFPDSTIASACTSSFSRFARRSLALRPAHSRSHQIRDRYPGASDISSPPCLPRLLPAGAIAGWALHPLEKRRLVTAHAVGGPSERETGLTVAPRALKPRRAESGRGAQRLAAECAGRSAREPPQPRPPRLTRGCACHFWPWRTGRRLGAVARGCGA